MGTHGAGGGAFGLAAGGVAGLSVGVLAAPLTLGLSLPIGAAVGGGMGMVSGSATGATIGMVRGARRGYKLTKIEESRLEDGANIEEEADRVSEVSISPCSQFDVDLDAGLHKVAGPETLYEGSTSFVTMQE